MRKRDRFNSVVFGTREIDTRHIGVLDGIRALAVMFVCGFHFWQQSWLWNLSQDKVFSWVPKFFSKIGVDNVSLNWLFQHGYVFVDTMILLTGLCLFLPYAEAMLDRHRMPSIGKFYRKRVARIFPSYYFCILVFAVFLVGPMSYGNVSLYMKDLFSHLTFTQMFSEQTYLHTQFNGVLWTLTVEMIFYIIFPFLARAFAKLPLLTYLAMNAASLIYYVLVIRQHKSNMSYYVNRFPTFLCVYANGMMLALVIVALAKNMKQNKYTGLLFTGLAIFGLYILRLVIKYNLATSSNGQFWQVQNRFLVSIINCGIILGMVFSFNWFRAIFSNPVMRYLSAISFNLYIWHQTIAVKLRENKVPYYDSPSGWPGSDAGRAWQWKYTLLCWLLSIVFATILTYFLEKPAHKLIMGDFGYFKNLFRRKKKETANAAKDEVVTAAPVESIGGTEEPQTEDYFIDLGDEIKEEVQDDALKADEDSRVLDITINSNTGE